MSKDMTGIGSYENKENNDTLTPTDLTGGHENPGKVDIPVVFAGGRSGCLATAIPQAAKYNKNIWLLKNDGDSHDYRDIIEEDKQFFWSEFSNECVETLEKYYVHYSPNPPEFEKQCFVRYIALYEFMKQKGFERGVLAEHDVMTFVDYGDFFGALPADTGAAVSFSKSAERLSEAGSLAWSGNSFWTRDALKDFIEFFLDFYIHPETGLEKTNKQGICDMTLTKLWIMSGRAGKIFNMAPVYQGMAFDHNLCQKVDYEGEPFCFDEVLRLKKWVIRDGVPFFVAEDGREIRALTMHFNGQAKGLIGAFAETGGDPKQMLGTPEGRKYKAMCRRLFRERILNGIKRRLSIS